MCHITIITYHKIQKLALPCEKLKKKAKVHFVYVSLLKQQGNGDFEFTSVCFSAVKAGYIRYPHTVSFKSYDLKI